MLLAQGPARIEHPLLVVIASFTCSPEHPNLCAGALDYTSGLLLDSTISVRTLRLVPPPPPPSYYLQRSTQLVSAYRICQAPPQFP